jgi:FkbM family methyltransferase
MYQVLSSIDRLTPTSHCCLMVRLNNLRGACRKVGVINTLLYIWKTKVLNNFWSIKQKTSGSYMTGTLSSKQLQHPVVFRYNSSDATVFSQIFVADEYETVGKLRGVKFIIDCGANVGYSTAYLLSKYPDARVIAVEPDQRNYELLRRNLAAYGDRVAAVCSAIWSHKARLKVSSGKAGDKSEYATRVMECTEGEDADLQAVDIASLLEHSGYDEIDILKMDVEGAESAIFRRNFQSWINKVRIFVIELHGQDCKEVFYSALGPKLFDFNLSGELTIARRRSETRSCEAVDS